MDYGTTTAIAGGLNGVAQGMSLGLQFRQQKNTEEERKRQEEERRLARERQAKMDQHSLDREGLADDRQKKLDAQSEEEHGWKKTEFQQKQKATVMASAFHELAANKTLSPDTVAQIKEFDKTFEKAEMTYGVDAAGMTVHVTRKEFVPDPKNPNAAPAVKYNTQSIPAEAAKKWFEGVLGDTQKRDPRLYPTGEGGYAAWNEETDQLQQVREPNAKETTPDKTERDPIADDASKKLNEARAEVSRFRAVAELANAELQAAIQDGASKTVIAEKEARDVKAREALKVAIQQFKAWQESAGGSGLATGPSTAPAQTQSLSSAPVQYGAGLDVGGQQAQPPVEGAQKAPDGKWYIQQDGKWHEVIP